MPGADRDDESGQYTEKYPTGRFLQAIDNVDGMAGTQDVADYVGCSYETAYKKLRKLEDSGSVNSQKVANARVWLRADDQTPSEQRETGESTAQSDDGTEQSRSPAPATDTPERAEFDREAWRERLAVAVPTSGDLADRRADAILIMYDHLREHGEADQDTLKELVDPQRVGYKNAESVWSNMVKGNDTLRALPGVEKPQSGQTNKPWRYRPEPDQDQDSDDDPLDESAVYDPTEEFDS